MSINFNPKISNDPAKAPLKPKKNLLQTIFQKLVDGVWEDYQLRIQPCRKYCQTTSLAPTAKSADDFMKQCIEDYKFHKLYVRWSDRN